jgi:hypothetical protein
MFDSITIPPSRKREIGVSAIDKYNYGASIFNNGGSILFQTEERKKKNSFLNNLLLNLDREPQKLSIPVSNENSNLKLFKSIGIQRISSKRINWAKLELLKQIQIETNFPINQILSSNNFFSRNVAEGNPDFPILNQIWCFPTENESILFPQRKVTSNEFWAMDTSTANDICKSLALKWQECLFSSIDNFLDGKLEYFYLIGDNSNIPTTQSPTSSSSALPAPTVSCLSVSAVFFHLGGDKLLPRCILVGAKKNLIRKIVGLGAEPFYISPPPSVKSDASNLSASGRYSAMSQGNDLYLTGQAAMRVVAHCLLEMVFLPSGPNSSKLLVDRLPSLLSPSFFPHSSLVSVNRVAVKCQSTSDASSLLESTATTTTTTSILAEFTSYKVHLIGDNSYSTIPSLIDILHQLSLSNPSLSSAPIRAIFKNNSLFSPPSSFPYPILLSNKENVKPKTSSQTASNPMMLTTSSSRSSQQSRLRFPKETSIEINGEELLSSDDWIKSMRKQKVPFFCIKLVPKSIKFLSFSFAQSSKNESPECNSARDVNLKQDSEFEGKDPSKELDYSGTISELRWHAKMAKGEIEISFTPQTKKLAQMKKVTAKELLSYYTDIKLDEESIVLEAVKKYDIFVENRIM